MRLVIAVRQHNVSIEHTVLYCLQLADCNTGAYAGFLRGAQPKKKLGFWVYMVRAAKLRVIVRGVWEHAPPPPPKKIYKNGAISYVLRAIFHHFHDEKSSKKI